MAELPTTRRRLLIVTGDDFGLSPAVNAAVISAHRHGCLTCASLMVGAPAAAAAAAQAQEHPGLCLGLHLTLIQGRPVLPPRQVPSLCRAAGEFRRSPVGTGFWYFFSSRARREIRAEAVAQIERLLSWGLKPWFINGHLNLHLHPAIWPLVVELAREYQIPAVRLAFEELRLNLQLDRRRPVGKILQALIFSWLSRRALRTIGALRYNDHLFGLLNAGHLTEDYLVGLLPYLKPGVTEIYSHPAAVPETEQPRWPPRYQHRRELAALLSPRLRMKLAQENIKLISYRELAEGLPSHV